MLLLVCLFFKCFTRALNHVILNLSWNLHYFFFLGEKWFSLFCKRHNITFRTPQTLVKSRVVKKQSIKNWFQEIKLYLTENNLLSILEDGSRVFNSDESGFYLCPKGEKVLCQKGEKHVYSISGNDEKTNLTVLVTANAAGTFAPPMIVYQYERIPSSVSQKVPDEWGIGWSEKGWMCGRTFYKFVANVFNL